MAVTSDPKRDRRCLRFSLRKLFMVVLMLGVVFGVLGSMAYEARMQRKVLAELRAFGVVVYFWGDPLRDEQLRTCTRQGWMPDMLDTGYLDQVVAVSANELKTITTYGDWQRRGLLASRPVQVRSLAQMSNLERIDLSNTGVSDVCALVDLKNLAELDLSHTQVVDVTPLAQVTSLERLNLSDTEVSTVAPLVDLKNLKFVNLSGTQVTDIAPLRGLPNLTFVYLHDAPVTERQVNDLREALPNCTIHR